MSILPVGELLANCLTADKLPLFGSLSGFLNPLLNFPAFYNAAQGGRK